MGDTFFSGQLAEKAETWLLPEVKGSNTFQAEEKRSSGYVKRQAGVNEGDKDNLSLDSLPNAISIKELERRIEKIQEKAFTEGRSDGYEKGFAEGEKRALQIAEQKFATQKQELNQLIHSITASVSEQSENLKFTLVEIIIKIVASISQHLIEKSNPIEELVKEAIDALPVQEQQIILHLNSDDAKLLESIPNFIDSGCKLTVDAQIVKGGGVVKTENSEVDFQLNSRINEALKALFPDISTEHIQHAVDNSLEKTIERDDNDDDV